MVLSCAMSNFDLGAKTDLLKHRLYSKTLEAFANNNSGHLAEGISALALENDVLTDNQPKKDYVISSKIEDSIDKMAEKKAHYLKGLASSLEEHLPHAKLEKDGSSTLMTKFFDLFHHLAAQKIEPLNDHLSEVMEALKLWIFSSIQENTTLKNLANTINVERIQE